VEQAIISRMASNQRNSLLAGLDWEALDERVRSQQRNREAHTPAISTFRWWARRSHALIGELLEHAGQHTDGFCVADPFSGGGTVAVEAARRGINVFAQDLHPWAVAGLRATLEPVDIEEFASASAGLLEGLAATRRELFATCCTEHGERSEVLTAFWVRVASCPGCDGEVNLFPYSLISRASRMPGERVSWWGCAACGEVTASAAKRPRRCGGCGAPLAPEERRLLPGRLASCSHEGCGVSFGAFRSRARWKMVLVQRRCRADGRWVVHLDRPTDQERRQASRSAGTDTPVPLREKIPVGLETRVLAQSGFKRWADLYTPRQLAVLSAAVPMIDGLRASAAVRARLRLALCGCAEMAGHLSRWDRYYPKAFEAMANHRFAVTGLSAETNLLAERGRGTLPRRLGHSLRAAQWTQAEFPEGLTVRRLTARPRARVLPAGVVVTEGSSEHQRAASGSVDLVLTDPPYFDDVQYAELAGAFLSWAHASGLVAASTQLDLGSEAVANSLRGTGVERYHDLLAAILIETRRTLASDGRMILTYHNTDLRAWWALGRALQSSGFAVIALAVTHAENERDHAKRGRLAFTRDLVIECVPSSPSPHADRPAVEIATCSGEPEALELLAAGRAIAELPAGETRERFAARLRALRGDIRPIRIGRRGDEQAGEVDD
jgi:putative DNA methylase